MKSKDMPISLVSKEDIGALIKDLNISNSDDVMVHASLHGLGYLINGAEDIVDAIMDVIGEEGTLLVPAHSGQLTDPADWTSPSVPDGWVPVIRSKMNPFDRNLTPVRNRGIVAEAVLRRENVERSLHPVASIAAIGRRSKYYTETHFLHDSEGDGSPCKKLVDNNGKVLLFGTGLDSCTALHVAEFIADVPYLYNNNMKVLSLDGDKREFVSLERYPSSSEYFEKIKPYLIENCAIRESFISDYRISVIDISYAVNHAVSMLEINPNYLIEK